ncbi:MAG: hypothetical protein IPK16_08625 [Anaerolineales bacterium]|nr:hypothetical protein [Anaerolineales bacterium]
MEKKALRLGLITDGQAALAALSRPWHAPNPMRLPVTWRRIPGTLLASDLSPVGDPRQ